MKRSISGFLAIVLAITCAAFTQPKPSPAHLLTNNNYRYTLTDNSGDKNPNNYVYTTDLSGCSGSEVVCIISSAGSTSTGGHPSFAPGTDPYNNTVGVSVVSQKPSL